MSLDVEKRDHENDHHTLLLPDQNLLEIESLHGIPETETGVVVRKLISKQTKKKDVRTEIILINGKHG